MQYWCGVSGKNASNAAPVLVLGGTCKISIDYDGNLVLYCGTGNVIQRKSVIYQQPNCARELVAYPTYLDVGVANAIDVGGNAYVTGWADGTLIATNLIADSYTAAARATDNNGATTTSIAVSVTVAANQLPTVSITSPASGATLVAPVDVNVTMSAADSDGSVARVELFSGSTLLATLTTAPYTFVWKNPLPGSYVLTAKATDDRGATRTSTTVPINIGGTAVLITAPADNASFAAPATFDLAVTARTSSATITTLDFFDGTTMLGTINIGVADASATISLREGDGGCQSNKSGRIFGAISCP